MSGQARTAMSSHAAHWPQAWRLFTDAPDARILFLLLLLLLGGISLQEEPLRL
jgi:hypothetical protein